MGGRKTPHPAAWPPASPEGRGRIGRASRKKGLGKGLFQGEARGRAPENGGYAKVSQERGQEACRNDSGSGKGMGEGDGLLKYGVVGAAG